MLLGEKYRLEIHWNKIRYNEEGVIYIDGCYFSGPVLREIEILNENDFIRLDFINQYIVFIKNYYIAKLFWNGVRYTPTKIFLYNVTLNNTNINNVPKLQNNDYIIVDTKDHEDDNHQYNMTYPAYLLRHDGFLYDFSERR